MHKLNDYCEIIQLITVEGRYSIYEYIPTYISPLAVVFEKFKLVRRIRFWSELLKGGYKVYYLVDGDVLVGHCVVTPGGRRLNASTKEDIVLGPYFVDSEFRGKGYAKVLVSMTLKYCSYD